MKERLTELEKEIIGKALAEIQAKSDVAKVISKVEGTVVGLNKFAMREFLKLAKMKGEILRR